MGALVVAILNKRDRRISRTAHMIVRTDGWDEHGRHGSPTSLMHRTNDEMTPRYEECDSRTIRRAAHGVSSR